MIKKFILPLNILSVIILSVSVMFLTACDPVTCYYNLDELRAPVKSIELINYDNPNQKSFRKWFTDRSGDLKPLDMSAMQTVATLNAEQTDNFMTDLSEQLIHYKDYEVDSPNGKCIKIVYEDNYFDIICCNNKQYIGTYAPNGEVEEFIGSFSTKRSFEYLLQAYFDI